MALLSSFSRLFLSRAPLKARTLYTSPALFIKPTSVLFAEPLKKKKKLDPQILKQREERRKKKIEKQIKRLEKNARQLKPIDEMEVPLTLIDEKGQRTRKNISLTFGIIEKRALLEKTWAKFKMQEKLNDYQLLDQIINSHRKALAELRSESEELYQEAIKPDPKMIPFKAKIVVATPPIENYDSPDGDYIDISKKWD